MSSMTATRLREFVIDRLMFEAENCEDAKVRLEALMHLQTILATLPDAATLLAALVAAAERERILEMCKEGLWNGEGIRYHLNKRKDNT